MKMQVQFSDDHTTKKWILSVLGKSLDDEDFIIDSESQMRISSRDGQEIHFDEWVGLDKGSLAFVRGTPNEILRMARRISE